VVRGRDGDYRDEKIVYYMDSNEPLNEAALIA